MSQKMFRRLRLPLIAAAAIMISGSAFADGPYQYFALTPCRVVDTRNPNSTNGGPMLQEATARDFQVRGLCGVPTTAKAASLNFTVVGLTGTTLPSWLTVWPSGSAMPGTATINFYPGDPPIANGAIATLSTSTLDLSVRNARGQVHVIIDVTGYFE